MRLLACVMAAVIAVCAGSLCAQGSFRQEDRRALGVGVYRGTVAFGSSAGTIDHAFTEVRFNEGGWLAGVTPLGSPLVAEDLLSLANSIDGRGAMALLVPEEGGSAVFPSGLRISGGRLVGWPADERVHLLLRPEGGALLTTLSGTSPDGGDPGPGLVAWDDGTTLTLKSINGRPPLVPGEASVYTGPLEARAGPFVAMGEELLFLLLEPAERTTVLENMFRGDSAERQWRPISVQTRGELRAAVGQAVLAVAVGDGAEDRLKELVARRSARVTITAPLDQDSELAAAVAPVGDWLVRGGEIVAPEGPQRPVYNAIATDDSGSRIVLWSVDPNRQRGLPIPLAQMAAFLREQGLVHAVAVADTRPTLLADARARNARDTRIATRYALVARNQALPVRLGAMIGDLYGVRGVIVEGTRQELPGNGPSSLRDGQIARNAELDGFWASPMPEGGRPLPLRMALSRPRPIAAVEIIHASAAGFSPSMNVAEYQIWGRARRDGPWTMLREVKNATPTERDRVVLEGSPRLNDLRIDIVRPSFLKSASVARLAEVILYSPEPEIDTKR